MIIKFKKGTRICEYTLNRKNIHNEVYINAPDGITPQELLRQITNLTKSFSAGRYYTALQEQAKEKHAKAQEQHVKAEVVINATK